MTPLIDVVVPTRDRPGALIACLRALAAQSVTGAHVIVVDDGSVKPVSDLLPPDLVRRLELTVLRNEVPRGPAAARNRAISHGRGRYIAFVDDDVRCEPDFLQQHLDIIAASGDQTVGIGPLRAPSDWVPTPWTLWEARQLEVEYARMELGIYQPSWRQFHTGNAFLARRVIEAAGLFDERFTRAEDVELGLRMSLRGCRFVFNPSAIGWHYSVRSLDAWLRIPRAYGQFDVLLASMHPSLKWLDHIRTERARRHALTKLARVPARNGRVRTWMVHSLTAGAKLGGRLRPLTSTTSRRLTLGLLSVAYDLEYGAALESAASRGNRRVDTSDARAIPTEGG